MCVLHVGSPRRLAYGSPSGHQLDNVHWFMMKGVNVTLPCACVGAHAVFATNGKLSTWLLLGKLVEQVYGTQTVFGSGQDKSETHLAVPADEAKHVNAFKCDLCNCCCVYL